MNREFEIRTTMHKPSEPSAHKPNDAHKPSDARKPMGLSKPMPQNPIHPTQRYWQI